MTPSQKASLHRLEELNPGRSLSTEKKPDGSVLVSVLSEEDIYQVSISAKGKFKSLVPTDAHEKFTRNER